MRAFLLPLLLLLTAATPPERERLRTEAARVTITRDDWGIAHVHGPSDADAVFGMIYAQAEDDFPRVEANYLTALGRTAEAEGATAMWQDLRARLYVSEPELKADYAASPPWLQRLMDAWADGLNYYLATHPQVRPRVLKRFEPWMALSFTEGSIGGDIERIDLGELERFYSTDRHPELVSGSMNTATASSRRPSSWIPDQVRDDGLAEPRGSNAIAIAPALTAGGKALLLINPHTSFFFRSEQQVASDQGLNAYGAATWGQFFIYQGFNAHAGWMHSSSGVDNVDEFAEQIGRKGKLFAYHYGSAWRPLAKRPVTIRYRTPDGRLALRSFTTWRTHRGPIVRSENGRWVAFAMMDRPVQALQQSFLRTKAVDLASFLDSARLQANSSNNTIFADGKGEIAYLHPQFVPRRDDRFDYTKPVDGSDPAADWSSLHRLTELPNVIDPPNGWVQNTNAWPYRAAGAFSPKPLQFPRYMDMFGENFRGLHAQQLLTGSRGWTLDRLQAAAFDRNQPGFAALIPTLVKSYDALPQGDGRRAGLAEPIALLRAWDFRWSAGSVANTLASLWGEAMWKEFVDPAEKNNLAPYQAIARASDARKLAVLGEVVERLKADFGDWQVPWGEINRFQRISPAIDHSFSDAGPSIAVPFSSGRWGSLASFGSAPKPGTRRWYGTSGNSFVAVVEFGPKVRAHAVTAGGESGNPASPHFNDEALRYSAGALREVYFDPEQLRGHTERTYRPGE
jgi:acyl-homoserine-lactone acylase